MTCLKCFRFQIPGHIKYSTSLQIRLLNAGLVTDALEISNRVSELIYIHESLENIPKEELVSIRKLEKKIDLAQSEQKVILTKNTETLRNEIINGLLKEIKSSEFCLHCRSSIDKIQVLRKKVILTGRKVNADDSQVKALQSRYIAPDESRRYLRQMFEQEKDLMKEIISVLAGIDTENPTDIFYWDIIPVLPPNVRPVRKQE